MTLFAQQTFWPLSATPDDNDAPRDVGSRSHTAPWILHHGVRERRRGGKHGPHLYFGQLVEFRSTSPAWTFWRTGSFSSGGPIRILVISGTVTPFFDRADPPLVDWGA